MNLLVKSQKIVTFSFYNLKHLLLNKTLTRKMGSEPKSKKLKSLGYLEELQERRNETADCVMNFPFNKTRVRVLTKTTEVMENCDGILYWMFRDGRVQDNWAFLFAQKLALKNKVPLHVCYCILPRFLDATLRHYKFLVESLEEVATDCADLNISFHLLHGVPTTVVRDLVFQRKMGALVVDFFPLRTPMAWVNELKNSLPENVPLCQVDAHNIVTCWATSDKCEYAARTIRPKIHAQLRRYLTEFPPLIRHPHSPTEPVPAADWKNALTNVEIDRTVDKVDWCVPGYRAALRQLEMFINTRLKDFAEERNNPTKDCCSGLSPWFHFGMISVQRVILEVQRHKSKHAKSVEVFVEESVVRRELSDNFCFYNENYDRIEGASAWAQETLKAHKKDKRAHMYNREEFEKAHTHEDLWNAAQNQLVREGKMHGFMRMYWAKKILEWSKTPEEALATAIYLNDKYSMDGRDPNGYVGCMWSICGIHDMGWKEREIFGKIRYMNYAGCARKFDIKAFVKKYDGKVMTKNTLDSFVKTEKKAKK